MIWTATYSPICLRDSLVLGRLRPTPENLKISDAKGFNVAAKEGQFGIRKAERIMARKDRTGESPGKARVAVCCEER
jgi:hypothetical protein